MNILLVACFFLCNTCTCQFNHTAKAKFDDEVYISTKDTRLFAHLRGSDSLAPVLLYLHGGPGSPLGVPILKAYAGPQLEEHVIMVYLHQRGIMKSSRVPDSTHTIDQYVRDVSTVVGYLQQRFKNRHIYLLGHSWGGLLGLKYLLEYPGHIDKIITVCTAVNIEAMITGRMDMILEWARATDNEDIIAGITRLQDKSIQDDPWEFRVLEHWMTQAYGGWHRNLDIHRINQAIDYEDHFPEWLKDQKHIEDLMIPEILGMDLTSELETLSTPLLSIAGRHDSSVPWMLIKEEFDHYGGPKTFQVFDHSHHVVFIDEEHLFVETVLNFLQTP
jgi:pimeloyl-ACP methyl ester carboxylesterase